MQFKAENKIIWEGNTWLILFVDELAVVLKPEDTNERVHLTRTELEKAYMEGKVKDTKAAVNEVEAKDELLFSDLSLRQRKIVTQRLEFIHSFELEGATVKNDVEVVAKIAKSMNLKKVPGVSSVRRWITKYRKSGEQAMALLDNRSNMVVE
jgi:hypothetical protein